MASRDARESVLLQGRDRNGAEQFVGQGESRQEALKVMSALDGTCQHPDHHALRGPFRPDEEDVLTGQDGEDQAFDLLASFEETAFHLRLEGLEPGGLDHARERLSARGAQIPFDGASPDAPYKWDRDSHLRVGGKERNEFFLVPFAIQAIQDFEVTGPVMVSKED